MLFGQEKPMPLRTVFEQLETQFDCSFSFADDDLKGHFLTRDNPANSLVDALGFLRQHTLFDYTLLRDRTVAVKKRGGLISVCFTVLDDENSLPLTDVSVVTPYQQFPTGQDGTLSFEVRSPDDTILLSYTGFENKEIRASSVSRTPCTFVVLNKKIEYLTPVVFTNYLAKGISKNINGSLKVNYDEFDILPGLIEPDVLQTIQALPGIQSVNETVSFINIRGGTNDQNLILWDGIKMYQSGHFFGLISAFNPNLTNEVTLIKNGSDVTYGDGVSGIISMQGDPRINSKFRAEWGTNLINTDAFVDVPLGTKASVQISGRKSINGIVETPTYNAYFDKAFQNTEVISNSDSQMTSDDSFTFYDTHTRLLYNPTEKDRIRVNFMVVANQLEFLENAVIDELPMSLRSDLEQNNLSAGVYYERIWNPSFSSDVQLYGSSYELKATNSDILNNQSLLQGNEVLESGFKITNRNDISPIFSARWGYQFNETGITNFEQLNNPFFERTDKQVLRTNSIFSEVTIQPRNNRTIINFGLRVNHISKFNDVLWEPRLSFNHRFLKHFTFEVLGELKSQTTSQVIDFQNDFLGVENRRWVLSNPENIPVLKGKQFSIGIGYSKDDWLVSAEPYIKEVSGITSQSQGFQNQFQDFRVNGSYLVTGVDLLISKRFRNIDTWLSYSYANNEYTFEALTPQKFPNNIDIRHTVTYGMNVSWKNFKFSGGFNWHSGKPTTLPVAGNEVTDGVINYGSPNAWNIKEYIRVDISGTYAFNVTNKIRGFAGVSIWNLFNTSNTVNRFYRLVDEDTVERIDERALDFTPNATFRLQF